MDRFILIFCVLSIPVITASPTMEGPPSRTAKNTIGSTESTEAGPPAPPPEHFTALDEDHPHPPIPEGEEIDEHNFICAAKLLTSAEIMEKFADVKEDLEDLTKTIDEIILENTKDLNSSSVREGDVRISHERKRRAAEADFNYDYVAAGAPEAPGLSIDEIGGLPPIDKVAPEGRSDGETIDQLFHEINEDIDTKEQPRASAMLMGQAAGREDLQQDELFDMDMLLTAEQKRELFANERSRKKRAAIKKTLWPKGILPYQMMGDTFREQDKVQIYAAMREWQEKTCVKFEPFTDSLARRLGHRNRLVLQNGGGCSSYVGVINRGPQPVTLARGCRIKSIVLHELGHAIGLHHEQCRPDRDDFVTINEGNVHRQMRYNFDKYSTRTIDSRGFAYDYTSIMHYGKTAFSNNRKITIQPKNNAYTNIIGNAKKLSSSDSGVVNKMYEGQCGKKDPITPTPTTAITTCKDRSQYCAAWKKMNQCEENPGYMTRYCTKTCGKCKGGNCKDGNKYCIQWSKAGYCTGKYVGYMTRNCAKSCGKCGTAWNDMGNLWGDNMPKDNLTRTDSGALARSNIAVIVAAVAVAAFKPRL